jgi:hypothetical protein
MRTAVNSRGKALIAIVLVVVLLLAALFVSHAVDEASSGVSTQAGAPAMNDSAPTRDTKPTAVGTDPTIASVALAESPAALTSDATREMGTEEKIQIAEDNATPVDVPREPRPDTPRARVAARCWGLRGDALSDYAVTLDRTVRTSGEASALISAKREGAGYATIFQTSAAAPVRGKRVEFSVDLRTVGATRGANLLLRAEDANGQTVAFDNMQTYGPDGRPDQFVNLGVKGNTEWSTQHVVVDIPDSARVITYGVSMFGGGKVWLDNAHIEVVSNDMATTAVDALRPTTLNRMPVNPASLTRSPRNLEFDLETQAGAQPCN